MNLITAGIYWVIVVMWTTILFTVLLFYYRNRESFGTTRLLLIVLGLDAARNIFENCYFGVFFGSKYGVFPPHLFTILGNPALLILPKLANMGAGILVLGVLLLRWLPHEIRERQDTERRALHLHALATTDAMTSLFNRRQFMTLAEAEWQRSRRYQRPMSLLMIDIDNFKTINDRYGHDAGDQIIIRVADLCARGKRNTDIAARLGGEEYAILLAETDIVEATLFAERLRETIASEIVAVGNDDIAMTVSIGVSRGADSGSLAEFLKNADVALYSAKHAGRNRTCRFTGTETIG